ncbi:MAG: Hpt domain-containing protein [Bacteroidota bacterium]
MSEKNNYDLSYLKEISEGDDVFVKEMVTQFTTDAPEFISLMKKFAREKDWKNLFSTVHRFASNIDFVGVQGGRELVDIIEDNARNEKDPEKTVELTLRLVDYCEQAREQLLVDFQLNTAKY